ncbi:type II secretion system F family protein [Rhodococcus tibetensis]|uniref:Type II secretion system F family protein n=1 Tax=Rhodococcus tibetensis TaxID=2965064 RepID=A0ABT1QJ73_9NOCA|nr:type II secretion system F family protein [Rhodococcus sp. FXJ9.536]MCQ4121693.1 type II secretion system F family protein [Rhodococcus sp. FXJ9.536]
MIVGLVVLACALLAMPSALARTRLLTAVGRRPTRRGTKVPGIVPPALVVLPVFYQLGGISVVLAAVMAGATFRFRYVRRRAARARDADLRVILSSLEVVTAELRVGAHPATACDTAADESSGVVSVAFRAASARARLGGTAADGLRTNDSRVGVELARVADIWDVAEKHGLALAELLEAARTDLLGRRRFRQRTEAGLAGARATASVLAGLPLLGIGLGHMMGAAPLDVLFGGGLGGGLAVLGTGLVCAGLLWTDRITAQVTE